MNEKIKLKLSTIYNLLGKNNAVYDRIYLLFWLFFFLKLKLISNFLVYHFPSCNLFFKERYLEHNVDTLLGMQLELISLLSHCFQYLKGAKILMFEFGISLSLNMFIIQPDRISETIIALLDVLIMIRCLQLLWLCQVHFEFFHQVA